MQASAITLQQAQADMRRAYFDGAPGIASSSAVWAAAGLAAVFASPREAVLALLFGGMLIHPLALLLCRGLGRSAKHDQRNPLASLAMATTVWLILSLPLAYVVSLHRVEWFFPAMLCVIGGRYMTFHALYGLRTYLLCGGVLAVAAFGLVRIGAGPATGAFAGAVIEAVFAAVMFRNAGIARMSPASTVGD